jgi:uncharacterized membrane protein YedE/YeeE
VTLLYGLLSGALFGYLLQRARVVRYDRQVGALRFQDMTIVKFMFSAILTGMVGIYLLRDFGLVKLSFKPALPWANVFGGLVFGAGWGLLGYCPGTALGALGEGRRDALWGVLGMLAGGALFAELYPLVGRSLLARYNLGYITIPQLLGVNHWFVIAGFVAAGITLFLWFERKGL